MVSGGQVVGECAPDRRERGGRLLAGEQEQRAAGLGVVAELVGLVERLLRLREIAEAQPHLADLRIAGGGDARRPGREQL